MGDPRVQLDVLCSIGEAVGMDVVVRAYRGRRPALRDAGQLDIAQALSSEAHTSWRHELEVSAGDHGEAIDLCLYGSSEILAAEIDRLVLDFQDQYRRNARKRDHLAARHQRPVRLLMVIQDTDRNRRAVQEHVPFLRTVLPARSREIRAAIRSGRPLGRDGLLWIRKPRSPDPRR